MSSIVADPTQTRSWRIRNSAWLLVPLLTLGCLSGAGLIVVGIRARRVDWWLPGVGYVVAGCSASFLSQGTAVGGAFFGLYWALWVLACVHSLLVNPAWLRWRAEQFRLATTAPAEATGQSMAVNVNTASPQQLAALPGFDPARAARVLAERAARQGFGSVNEFAEAAGLTHDELRQLRYWLTV
ncbi:helix-hairpin-helix domain-containing protein [Dactylosporangium sp. NPDC005555]|uniref:ComEA family DNA-binding protein n=1 Tax=Dactylosporangium sp. NPDC005555 TaxID=3154889 RepID=UPI00339F06C3